MSSFNAKARPITNEEVSCRVRLGNVVLISLQYAKYLEQTHSSQLPASWSQNKSNAFTSGFSNGYTNGSNGSNEHSNGHNTVSQDDSIPLSNAYLEGKSVRTVYGLVPLKFALDWPVFASYTELSGCAAWMGGRIPTVEEARSIYSHVDGLRLKEAEQHLGKTVPAVNRYAIASIKSSAKYMLTIYSHLVNNGVQESPPSRGSEGGEGSEELFTNLEGANVGFKNWHPVAVTANGHRLSGQADMGGVWEWTSSPLTRHEGFEPMPMYPAYTGKFRCADVFVVAKIPSRLL